MRKPLAAKSNLLMFLMMVFCLIWWAGFVRMLLFLWPFSDRLDQIPFLILAGAMGCFLSGATLKFFLLPKALVSANEKGLYIQSLFRGMLFVEFKYISDIGSRNDQIANLPIARKGTTPKYPFGHLSIHTTLYGIIWVYPVDELEAAENRIYELVYHAQGPRENQEEQEPMNGFPGQD